MKKFTLALWYVHAGAFELRPSPEHAPLSLSRAYWPTSSNPRMMIAVSARASSLSSSYTRTSSNPCHASRGISMDRVPDFES